MQHIGISPQSIGVMLLIGASLANPSAGFAAELGSASSDVRTAAGAPPVAGTADGNDQLDTSTFEAYEDSASLVVRLSSEETVPFPLKEQIVVLRPIDEKTIDLDRWFLQPYKIPAANFPDVRSCLVTKERDKAKPDLTAFDWRSMGDRFDAEVCIFRILTSYRLWDDAGWLASQGFKIIVHADFAPDPYGGGGGYGIFATWKVKESGVLLEMRSNIEGISTNFIVKEISIDISYFSNSDVPKISIEYSKD